MSEVTKIIEAVEPGEPQVGVGLLPILFAESRRLTAQRPAQEKLRQTLEPTALVHEAHLRLVGDRPEPVLDTNQRRLEFWRRVMGERHAVVRSPNLPCSGAGAWERGEGGTQANYACSPAVRM
jgi:hypothetical protein